MKPIRLPVLGMLCALIASGCASREPVPAADPLVRTTNAGAVRGMSKENGSLAWLGIPYAKPPVGALRWQAPQPVEPWQGEFVANQAEHVCMQFASNLTDGIADEDKDGVVGTEDCLYLNVFAPANASADNPLPVMFWIFGGGNNSGYAGDYDAANLAQKGEVVVVSVNYRLGALGWFRHPAIVASAPEGVPRSGNWADLDMQLALKWVQQNIRAFGGDPGNVTIFGESAGGANVMSLMYSPPAKGLFHRAIVQSGGIRTMPVSRAVNFTDDAEPGSPFSGREIVNRILIRDGKAKDRLEAKKMQLAMTDDEVRALLYAQDPASFLKLYNPSGARNYPSTQKIADGTVYPTGDALANIAAGQYQQVPVILGTNRDERRIYMFRAPRWQKVLKDSPDDYVRFAHYPSLEWKVRGVDALARAMTPHQPGKVFAYRFDWDESGKLGDTDLSVAVGAAHSTEIAFVFGEWSIGFMPEQAMYPAGRQAARDTLSDAMMSYWTHFAYTGDPGKGRAGQQVAWQPWSNDANAPKSIILDTKDDGGIRMMNEEVTRETLKQQILADRFNDQKLHCEAYVATYFETPEFDAKEYARLGNGGCAKYPPEKFEASF